MWPFNRSKPPEKKSVDAAAGPPLSLLRGYGGATIQAYTFSTSELIKNYRTIAPLNAAVRKISQAVATLPIFQVDNTSELPVRNSDLIKLLNTPNIFMQRTKQDFFRDIALWKVLEGDAYILATGPVDAPPLELYVLSPENMVIQPDKHGFPTIYQYIQSTGFSTPIVSSVTVDGVRSNSTMFFYKSLVNGRIINEARTAELYHIANFSSNAAMTRYTGESEVQSLYYELNTYLLGSQHNMSLLSNGARPSGAFILKNADGTPALLSDEQFQRIKAQIEETYTGSSNAGRPLILEGGLEWKEMGVNLRDMDFVNLRKEAEKQIYKTLQVPIELVMAEGTTYDNLANVRIEFYENRILPFTVDIMDHLNRFLIPRFYPRQKNQYSLAVNKDAIDVFAPIRERKRDIIEKSLIITMNEKRKQFNMDNIQGGDKIVDPNGRPIAGPDAEGLVQAPAQPPEKLLPQEGEDGDV